MTASSAYLGNDPAALPAYEAWLGHHVDSVLFYLNNDSWSAFDSSIAWAVDLWKPTNTPVIWSVPLTVWGTSLEQVAAGAYDSHFHDAAVALAAARTDANPIYVRVGWEFNGTWMPWAAEGHEDAFVQAFRNLVGEFRSVSDQFRFVWDVNNGGGYDPASAYPGDNYVDIVGMDFYYDTAWDSADPLTAFQNKVNQPYGLAWQQDFAAAHDKLTAISEWGVSTDNAGPYIERAAAWFQAHGVVYQSYWESNCANYDGMFHDGSKPDAGAAFRSAFASGDLTIVTDQADTGVVVPLPAGGMVSFTGSQNVAIGFALAGNVGFSVEAGHRATIAGQIGDGSAGQTGILEKSGEGTLVLLGDNTHSGGTLLNEGELYLASASAAGPGAIAFKSGEAATLSLTAAALPEATHHFANTIAGFDADDVIDLLGTATATGVSFNHATGSLSLQDASGATIAALQLLGDYRNDRFDFMSDGRGGTAIILDPADTSGTLRLRVSEDAFQGDAQFIVTVDGHQIGGIQTAHASHAAGQAEDIVLHGDFGADPSLVSVQFLNDAYGGSDADDRNLYVDAIAVNGHHYAGNVAANYAGQNVGTDAGMFYNGSALFRVGESATNSLTLTVSGDAYQGNAQFTVFVDGRAVGGAYEVQAAHAEGQSQEITIEGEFGRNPGEVRVDFTNDLYGGLATQDRNLYVEALSINGHHVDGAAGHNLAGWNDGSTADLFSNGSLVFNQNDAGWHV